MALLNFIRSLLPRASGAPGLPRPDDARPPPAGYAHTAEDLRLCESGEPRSAIAACTRILNAASVTPAVSQIALYNRGCAHARLGQHQEAVADFTAAIRNNPVLGLAHFNRGNSYKDLQQYDLAIADYTKVIAMSSHYWQAHNNRGIVYAEKGDFDRALADFDAALRVNPDSPNARQARARAVEMLRRGRA